MYGFNRTLNKDNASGRVSVNMKVSAPENRKKSTARFVLKDQENGQCCAGGQSAALAGERRKSCTGEIQTDDAQCKSLGQPLARICTTHMWSLDGRRCEKY